MSLPGGNNRTTTFVLHDGGGVGGGGTVHVTLAELERSPGQWSNLCPGGPACVNGYACVQMCYKNTSTEHSSPSN